MGFVVVAVVVIVVFVVFVVVAVAVVFVITRQLAAWAPRPAQTASINRA